MCVKPTYQNRKSLNLKRFLAPCCESCSTRRLPITDPSILKEPQAICIGRTLKKYYHPRYTRKFLPSSFFSLNFAVLARFQTRHGCQTMPQYQLREFDSLISLFSFDSLIPSSREIISNPKLSTSMEDFSNEYRTLTRRFEHRPFAQQNTIFSTDPARR